MEVKVKLNKELAQQVITDSYPKSSQFAIEVLNEILQHHSFELRNNVIHMPLQDGWTVSYKHFMDKYGFGYAKIRYAMRKLSKYDLVDRKMVITKSEYNTTFVGSKINLKINFEKVKNLIFI